MTHICVGNLTTIGSDNGLSPGRRQAIIWTNAGILLIGPLGTNFSEILIEIHTFSFTKMLLKMSSGKWRPFCLGLNVLRVLRGYQYNMAARMTWCIAVLCLKIYPRRFQTFIISSKMLNMIDLLSYWHMYFAFPIVQVSHVSRRERASVLEGCHQTGHMPCEE